jgi:hypothetical protein
MKLYIVGDSWGSPLTRFVWGLLGGALMLVVVCVAWLFSRYIITPYVRRLRLKEKSCTDRNFGMCAVDETTHSLKEEV